jgi:hypothetical protein
MRVTNMFSSPTFFLLNSPSARTRRRRRYGYTLTAHVSVCPSITVRCVCLSVPFKLSYVCVLCFKILDIFRFFMKIAKLPVLKPVFQ